MKQLKSILLDICNALNLPTNKDEAINKGFEMYLELEFASHYGGYRVVNVGVKNGAHYGAFGESSSCSRKSKKEMLNYLEGILYGIEYNKNKAS